MTLGFKWILRNYVLGHLFFFVVCFVKLSDPAALKLNNNNKKKKKKKKKKWPQELNLSSFLLRYIYI